MTASRALRRAPADPLAFADARHLAALEDLCPGVLVWIGGAWRRGLDAPGHTSDTINALLHHRLAQTSLDNITVTTTGVRARETLARRARIFEKMKELIG